MDVNMDNGEASGSTAAAADVQFFTQFACDVLAYSSQYGGCGDDSYCAENVVGRPTVFPVCVNSNKAYAMQSYGPWKDLAPSRKCQIMPQTPCNSDDFIIVSFRTPVIPMVVSIFETFAPGSVVRISGKLIDVSDVWKLLWEGTPQICNLKSRLFVPKLKDIQGLVKEICIEFNHSLSNNHTQIDAVSLGGVLEYPESGGLECLSIPLYEHLRYKSYGFDLYDNEMKKCMPESPVSKPAENPDELESERRMGSDVGHILNLANETLVQIFLYLDLKSLRLLMRVCHRFHNLCKDGPFYKELNLKPYWSKFSLAMLKSFQPHRNQLTKLDLSWCGIVEVLNRPFNLYLQKHGGQLTNLRLDNCRFVNDSTLSVISSSCLNLQELSLRSCSLINFDLLDPVIRFPQMEYLDLYNTNIKNVALKSYLMHMPKLIHINLGLCQNLESMNGIVYTFTKYNQRLKSINFWRSQTITAVALGNFRCLPDLEEVDLGWCPRLNRANSKLFCFTKTCSKLKKIVLVSMLHLSDQNLFSLANNCPLLEHIDLTGVGNITMDGLSKFLNKCENLKLLNLNFCDRVDNQFILGCRAKYPNVTVYFTINQYPNLDDYFLRFY